jgi:hypothetical protein
MDVAEVAAVKVNSSTIVSTGSSLFSAPESDSGDDANDGKVVSEYECLPRISWLAFLDRFAPGVTASSYSSANPSAMAMPGVMSCGMAAIGGIIDGMQGRPPRLVLSEKFQM